MTFSELLQQVRTQHTVVIPPDWAQGRAGFGGLVVALGYEAMLKQVGSQRPVRSLAITFVGPAAPETELSFEVQILREGKAVTQVLAKVCQGDQVVTLMQGSFGLSRPSQIEVEPLAPTSLADPQDCQALPYIAGVTPEFTRHIALHWGIGGLPFSHTPSRQMAGWMRFREQEPHEVMTHAHLLALVDAWPPAVLPYLKHPAPGSSLTWTIEFVHPLPELGSCDWLRYYAEIDFARDGYGHVAASTWSADGRLLAISRQTVSVFG